MEHKPHVIDNVDDLAREFRSRISGGVRVVAIAGFHGSGKTTVAKIIAKSLDTVHIELDDFLERNRGGFLQFIDYHRLEQAIRSSCSSKKAVLIEGVCVKAVLQKIATAEDLHLYVKRTGQHRLWFDGSTFERFSTFEDALRYEEGQEDPVDGLTRDLLWYHYQYQPHQTADIVYERGE